MSHVVRNHLEQLRGMLTDPRALRRLADLDDELSAMGKTSNSPRLVEAIGEVVCARCRLACSAAGPGCAECWDRRQVYEEARHG